MADYQPQFRELLKKAGVSPSKLDRNLQNLIDNYQKAYDSLKPEGNDKQRQWMNVLVQTDAVISAALSRLFNVLPERHSQQEESTAEPDKVKLMALKARALQLKWKMKNN